MDAAAIKHARTSLDRAKRALARFESAPNFDEAEEAWDHFLHGASRVYEKLKAGARGYPESWAWFGKKLDERRDDELLCYIHHARNSDHHRFEDILKREPGGFGIGAIGRVRVYEFGIDWKGEPFGRWEPETPGAQLIVHRQFAHLRLVPVIDKAITYPVPTKHSGKPVLDRTVMSVGQLMVAYLESSLDEAASLLR
jgi:hypothetical protein